MVLFWPGIVLQIVYRSRNLLCHSCTFFSDMQHFDIDSRRVRGILHVVVSSATKNRTTPPFYSWFASISNAGRTHVSLLPPTKKKKQKPVGPVICHCAFLPTLEMKVSICHSNVSNFREEYVL